MQALDVERRFDFIPGQNSLISALHGTGVVGELYPSIHRAYESSNILKVSPAKCPDFK